MSLYHRLGHLEKKAYTNPYRQITATPSMGGADVWQSAPGLRPPDEPGLANQLWKNKGRIAGSIGAGLAGAKLGAMGGAAIGSVAPLAGTAVGGALGGIGGFIGGVGMSLLGEEAGGSIDDKLNASAAAGQPYRPPVTDLSSYGANMLAQGMDETRPK